MPPETRHAKSGDINIAYQVVGGGPLDLVLVPAFVSHLDLDWEEPRYAHFLRRLASFSRLIRFDKRGTGLSDRPGGLPDLETRMDDVRAVLDTVGSERAALLGYSEGGPMCILFAATYPERTSALVLYGTYAKRRDPDDDYPWAATWEERQAYADQVEREWGTEADLGTMAPNADDAMVRWWRARARASASPGAAKALILMNSQIDVRGVLSSLRVPTLVLHRHGDHDSRLDEGSYIAEHIPGARFVELEGEDHVPSIDSDQILDEVEEFLTGARRGPEPDRVLATVLFTDIVGSTERATELGDRRWRELLERHRAVVRRELERFRGREIDTAGDGFLATFDGPARAIRCARAIGNGVRGLGIEVRAGLHTGECEVLGDKVAGVAGAAGPGEVLVSPTPFVTSWQAPASSSRTAGSTSSRAWGLGGSTLWSMPEAPLVDAVRMPPETRYAKSGDVNIAYQVVGEGPLDLVLVHGWVQSFDAGWEIAPIERFYRRLASFSRLILFDKRGTGLSDRVALDNLPTLETRMDDMRAVMDAVGVEGAAVLGHSEGGAMCGLFAATYPERTQALVMVGSAARTRWAPDYPLGATDEVLEEFERSIRDGWGSELIRSVLQQLAPSIADDEELVQAHTRAAVRAASPAAAAALTRMSAEIDIRHVLPAIRVPTLVMHRTDEVLAEASRYVGERIPGAKVVELPGRDHMPWLGDQDAPLDEIQEFLTGVRPHPALDRVLATVLFTDIVGSTELAADLGDRRWRELLERHNALVRRELGRFRGRELNTAGDSFLATFDGPARAIVCAVSIRDAARALGLQIRFGLHTGELELQGTEVRGIAVHTGARVAGKAGPGEVLASSTVKDLVAGSGLQFEDRGSHELKGVPGEWRLYAVTNA